MRQMEIQPEHATDRTRVMSGDGGRRPEDTLEVLRVAGDPEDRGGYRPHGLQGFTVNKERVRRKQMRVSFWIDHPGNRQRRF